MNFAPPPRRRPAENLLPMINVVFLLLIFFLISAELAPPEPFPVAPPQAEADAAARGELVVFLATDGTLGYRDLTATDAVMAALGAARREICAEQDCAVMPPPLVLRADGRVSADTVARLLADFAALGFGGVDLVTAAP